MAAAVLLLFTAIPRQQCVRDVVDVIEVNHVVDGNSTPGVLYNCLRRIDEWMSRGTRNLTNTLDTGSAQMVLFGAAKEGNQRNIGLGGS